MHASMMVECVECRHTTKNLRILEHIHAHKIRVHSSHQIHIHAYAPSVD